MKTILASLSIAAALVLGSPAARAHSYDHVTEVDRYGDADVVHYDHHHKQVYVDRYGRVVGERTIHHDHHYVALRRSYRRYDDDYDYVRPTYYRSYDRPAYRSYSYGHCDYDRPRPSFSFFFGR